MARTCTDPSLEDHLPLHLRTKPTLDNESLAFTIYTFKHQSDNSASAGDVIAYLHNLIASVDYMWQYPDPGLTISHSNCKINGELYFGDCLFDEKFVCWLLVQVTSQFGNWIAHIQDVDGEFLLIQTADYLPKWITPENASGRVFIRHGKLHLVLRPTSPAEMLIIPTCVTFEAGLKLVDSFPEVTEAPMMIQACFQKYLEGFPQLAYEQSHHNVTCFLPARVALLIHEHPNLITSIVHAFTARDLVDLQRIKSMCKVFPQEDQKLPMVRTRMRFTRQLYASLICSQFEAPNVFRSKVFFDVEGHREQVQKAFDIGVRMCCGLEILCANEDSRHISQLLTDYSPAEDDIERLENRAKTPDDDESWMNVSESDVEILLDPWKNALKDDDDLEKLTQAKNLVGRFKQFVEQDVVEDSDSDTEPIVNVSPDDWIPADAETPLQFDLKRFNDVIEREFGSNEYPNLKDEQTSIENDLELIFQEMEQELNIQSADDFGDSEILQHILESFEMEQRYSQTGPMTSILSSLKNINSQPPQYK